MEKNIKYNKLQFLLIYAQILRQKMMDKLQEKNILYIVQNILLCKDVLEECIDYEELNQYLEQSKMENINQTNNVIALQEVLSVMISFNSKTYSQNTVKNIEQILEYKTYIKEIA